MPVNPKAKAPAISPTRAEDYAEWYQAVVRAADLAELSPVRGCMVIKPWGYGIWEKIQSSLDRMIKETGHENAYFPLFIPLSYLEAEAAHVEGFAKECAVVTHHRLENKHGRLVPSGPLDEPLVVRPTSETIIGAAFAKWVQSYRDLPLLINQWANVVRWEMRTRIFLRTSEFLWQEGHTAHVSSTEAMEETIRMLEVYQTFAKEYLAIPVITGEKTATQRFPGAVNTYCIEAMMQDSKALQSGTSHYLGQGFAKASGIRFLSQHGQLEYAFTTSWGVSSRLIGGLIMTHADDDGMRVPPRVAPKQVVVIPVLTKPELEPQILAACENLARMIASKEYSGSAVSVYVDRRPIQTVDKKWTWLKKGVQIRVEIGPREVAAGTAVLYRRDGVSPISAPLDETANRISTVLAEIQSSYLAQATEFMRANTRSDIYSWAQLTEVMNSNMPGFVRAKWCGSQTCESRLDDLSASIRCIPLEQSKESAACVFCAKSGAYDIVIAKAY